MLLKDLLKREKLSKGDRLLNEYGERVVHCWKGDTEVLWEKPIPVGLPQFPTQITDELTRDWTLIAAATESVRTMSWRHVGEWR